MAIYLYYGKVGDGKSYHVVATEILPAVRDGRKMYVYMDGLNPRRLSQLSGRNSNVVLWETVDQVREACRLDVDDREGVGLRVDRGSLIVVDEAQLVWDAREWKNTGKEALAFFEYHRHFGLDVVVITQSPGRLDKGLVRLANECLHVKNLRFLSTLFGRRYVVNVRQSPYDREPVATLRGKFEDNIFACYRSATLVRSTAKVHGRGLNGAMLWGPAAVVITVLLYVRGGGLAVLKGPAPPVVIDSGPARPAEGWPKPGAELRRLDPPIIERVKSQPEITDRVDSEARPVSDDGEASGDNARIVGVVETDGVVVKTWREGDGFLK